jgi:DNA invertase Pin-like site-specific DNA recombinase
LDQDTQLQLDALERAGCWPIYQEKVSGVSTKRPVRDEALATLQRGDRLTVWKLDRLGRSVAELLAIISDLEARGVRFRCLTQPIDTSTPSGRAFLGLLAVFAEFERDLIRERTMAGKARRIADGKHPGGPRMFGYGADHTTVIEAEAELIREATRRLVAGQDTLSAICEDWNARGLAPLRGQRWRVSSLRRTLLNPRVAPLVGTDSYRKLVGLFDNRGNRRQQLGRPATYLLSGILHCGREGCGRPMYGTWKVSRSGARELYYRCKPQAGSGGRFTGCGATGVSLARADDWAREAFIAAVAAPDFAAALDRRRAALLATEPTAADLEDMQAELGELEAILPTRYGTPDLRRRQAELRRLVSEATARLMAQPELQALYDLPRSEAELRAAWDAWSVPERRVWLRRVLERIEVAPATAQHRGSDVEARFAPSWKV